MRSARPSLASRLSMPLPMHPIPRDALKEVCFSAGPMIRQKLSRPAINSQQQGDHFPPAAVPMARAASSGSRLPWSPHQRRLLALLGKTPGAGTMSLHPRRADTATLSCIALDGTPLTKSTTVKILPTFQEL